MAPSTGWTERHLKADGRVIARWRERPKPGCPGVTERHYLQSEVRVGPVVGSARVVGSRPARTITTTTTRPPQAKAKASRPSKPREIPELRADAEPRVSVTISPSAVREIHKEIACSRDQLEAGRETAGHLFRRRARRDDTIYVELATGLGTDGERMRSRVAIGWQESDLLEAQLARDENLRYERCGTWHTHPWRQPFPSVADRSGSLRCAEASWLGRDLVLIFLPDAERGWSRPEPRAWITHRRFGDPITEPCQIVDERAKRRGGR